MKRQVTIDDLDGTHLPGDAAPVVFSLDGQHYEIDLSNANRSEFAGLLAPYIERARLLATPELLRERPTAAPSPKVIREFAALNGLSVAPRGRIPAAIRKKYLAQFEKLE